MYIAVKEETRDEKNREELIVDAYLTEKIDEFMLHDVLRHVPDEEVDEFTVWIIISALSRIRWLSI